MSFSLSNETSVLRVYLIFKNRAYRYPPDVAFYVFFFFNKYKYWVF